MNTHYNFYKQIKNISLKTLLVILYKNYEDFYTLYKLNETKRMTNGPK